MRYTYTAFAFLLTLGLALAQDAQVAESAQPKAADATDELKPRIFQRVIPADVLRDFPNFCFASTLCRLFKDNQTWSLQPFCGQSHCKRDEATGRLFEVVLDCGPRPTNYGKDCIVLSKANETAEFPQCCDIYDPKTCQFPDLTQQAPAQQGQADLPDGLNRKVQQPSA